MLAPEAPYPLQGGGAYRTASLLHYFARFAPVDLILISESSRAAVLPQGLIRSQTVIPLPLHRRDIVSRYLRNAGRVVRGVPPLMDRLSGLGAAIGAAVEGRSYDLGIVEHFWCAPYLDRLREVCGRTVLDLHNIESVLHDRCASVEGGLIRAGHVRFARMYEQLEAEWFPRYSRVLVASESDASAVLRISRNAPVSVYPNALPERTAPETDAKPVIVFSGNFEYHPNIDAVQFFVSRIWPGVRAAFPDVKLRLVGRGDYHIRHLLPANRGIEVTGAIDNAFSEIVAARVVVAPLRAGSGTRIKILEGWAAGRPVIATPLAAEGLNTRNGENILLAGDSEAFGAELCRLLSDPKERQRLGQNGRQTFESHYTWAAAWRSLDCLL